MNSTGEAMASRCGLWAWQAERVTAGASIATFSVPTGTVAFLLTDVEGSTRLWEQDPDAMTAAMASHYALVDECVSSHRGVRPVEQGEGDSVVAAFSRASDAILAARDLQRALTAQAWPTSRPMRVRMAVHAGEARVRDAVNYAGEAIIRTARLRAIGHGGQVLVSQAARDLAIDLLGDEVEFADLGEYRLKDLACPEHVWQLRASGLPEEFGPLVSLDTVPNNLPSILSKFIGRSEELPTVGSLLDADRLVTLTGAGGAGKSRLALHVAADVIDRFKDGVWWVELAPVAAPGDVVGAISNAMGVPDPGRGDPLERLGALLANQGLLVVVDNAEHVVDEVARVVAVLLSRCPYLRVLVTSRRPLELAGEVTYRVPPLSCPTDTDTPDGLVALGQYDAVNLFVDRARRVRPGFSLSDANAADVADVCDRVDGLPLAIELAAARCRSLSPAQIRAGLVDSLRLLTGGGRTVSPRQQTLEASIEWSHDLLDDRERTVLHRLAVFHGGWTLPAAEAVVADGGLVEVLDVLDILDRLVQHSLVHVEGGDGATTRYRMLETVRQYGARHLRARHELDEVGARYADWILTMLQDFGQWAADERVYDIWWVLKPELANIDAGIAALYQRGDHLLVAAALVALHPWFTCSRRYPLVVRWSEPLVQDQSRVATRQLPELLAFAGLWRVLVGQWSTALPLLQRARRLAEAYADAVWLLRLDMVASTAATVLLTPGNDDTARDNLERARQLDSLDPFLLPTAIFLRIGVYITAGRPLEATSLLEEFRTTPKAISMTQDALNWEGTYARMSGRMAESLAFYKQVHDIDVRCGSLGHSSALGGQALSAFEAGVPGPDEDRLAEIVHQAVADGDTLGIVMAHLRIGYRAARLDDAPAALEAFEAAGAAMPATLFAAWADAGLVPIHDQLDQPDDMTVAIGRLRATGQPLRVVLAELGDAALALRENHPNEAASAAYRAVAGAAEHGLLGQLALAYEVLADATSRIGEHRHATRILGAAHRLRHELGAHGSYPIHTRRRTATIERLHDNLGADSYNDAFTDGSRLAWQDVVAYIQRARGERKRPAFGWAAITPTERRIIDTAVQGLTNAQIASQLLMGAETVKTHLTHIYTKLGVKNRTQLATVTADIPTNETSDPAP